MLAYLRTIAGQQSPNVMHERIATIVIRDNVRNKRAPLTNVHYHDSAEVAAVLAEIYAREFTSLVHTLNHANSIASKYHEAAFDNTDAYIDVGQVEHSPQSTADEMTAEQRHASKLLSGMGTNYSEIMVAIQMLGCSSIQAPRDIIACNAAMFESLAQHFHTADPSIVEDAFDRLHHIVKQVWTLVNTLAFSNLFRFVDPKHPISIPTSNDAIFVPYIPTAHCE